MNFRKPQLIRLVIVDDHPIFRDGLRRLLEREPDLKVIGVASDGAEAVKLARQLKADILLTDLRRPKDSGFETLRELNTPSSSFHLNIVRRALSLLMRLPTANATPVTAIVLTGAIQKSEIVEALQLGARGVVLKDSATKVLLKAIHTVMAGKYWVGRESFSNRAQYLRTLKSKVRPEKFGPHTPRARNRVSSGGGIFQQGNRRALQDR